MNAPIDHLRRMVTHLADVTERASLKNRGYAYSGMADFVLRHGVEFRPEPLPEGVDMGLPRHCFGNSIVRAYQHPTLFYVEGYALRDGIPMPIHHGWLTDGAGAAFDPTWSHPLGRAYLGVVFNVGRADDATWNGDATVLDDWKRDWPIFKEPWPGEDMGRHWPPTEAITEMIRVLRRRAGGKKSGR